MLRLMPFQSLAASPSALPAAVGCGGSSMLLRIFLVICSCCIVTRMITKSTVNLETHSIGFRRLS